MGNDVTADEDNSDVSDEMIVFCQCCQKCWCCEYIIFVNNVRPDIDVRVVSTDHTVCADSVVSNTSTDSTVSIHSFVSDVPTVSNICYTARSRRYKFCSSFTLLGNYCRVRTIKANISDLLV